MAERWFGDSAEHIIRLNESGSVPVFEVQLAFAFAGSVLAAHMTYAMAVSYLRGLTGPQDAELPTIGDFVGLIDRIGTTYADETKLRSRPHW